MRWRPGEEFRLVRLHFHIKPLGYLHAIYILGGTAMCMPYGVTNNDSSTVAYCAVSLFGTVLSFSVSYSDHLCALNTLVESWNSSSATELKVYDRS